MADMQIKDLFALDINRPIEEVIKVDQDDEQIVHDEIAEYIVTDATLSYYRKILKKYWETKNKPHEGIGIWVSGFFGSGKSASPRCWGWRYRIDRCWVSRRPISSESGLETAKPRS